MFKVIFRTITLIMFLFFLIIGIAVWKGGGPFRTMGKGITEAGSIISKFGDLVDDVKRGGKKINKTYNKLRDTISEDGTGPGKYNQ